MTMVETVKTHWCHTMGVLRTETGRQLIYMFIRYMIYKIYDTMCLRSIYIIYETMYIRYLIPCISVDSKWFHSAGGCRVLLSCFFHSVETSGFRVLGNHAVLFVEHMHVQIRVWLSGDMKATFLRECASCGSCLFCQTIHTLHRRVKQ